MVLKEMGQILAHPAVSEIVLNALLIQPPSVMFVCLDMEVMELPHVSYVKLLNAVNAILILLIFAMPASFSQFPIFLSIVNAVSLRIVQTAILYLSAQHVLLVSMVMEQQDALHVRRLSLIV